MLESKGDLIVKIEGKDMGISIYDNRVVISKRRWRYYHSSWYSKILEVQFKEPSYKQAL